MYNIIREVYEYTSIDNQQQADTLLVAIYSVRVGVCGGSHVLLDIDVYICHSETGRDQWYITTYLLIGALVAHRLTD